MVLADVLECFSLVPFAIKNEMYGIHLKDSHGNCLEFLIVMTWFATWSHMISQTLTVINLSPLDILQKKAIITVTIG